MRNLPQASELAGVALFPLRDAVLIPEGIIPLNVFEPRYLAMTEDALASTKLIAVPRLAAGYEADYAGSPAIHPVAGLGEIIEFERTSDGRYLIVLRGIARVSVDDELPARAAYRQANARPLDDTSSRRSGFLADGREQLIAMCDVLSMQITHGDKLRELARDERADARLVDALGAALVVDADARQTLLETLDPADRLDQLLAHIGELIALTSDRSALPN